MSQEDHRWLLETGKFSDFIIVCQDSKIKAHKLMLCAHSKYFENIMESDEKCGIEYSFGFMDDDPKLMKYLLDYFYRGTTEWRVPESSLSLHVDLWILAEQVQAMALMLEIEKRIMKQLNSFHNKKRVADAAILKTVFSNPACADSAVGYIIGEAAWTVLINRGSQKKDTQTVNAASSKYHSLANIMIQWSLRYNKFTEDSLDTSTGSGNFFRLAKTEKVREEFITSKLTKPSRHTEAQWYLP